MAERKEHYRVNHRTYVLLMVLLETWCMNSRMDEVLLTLIAVIRLARGGA